MKDIKWSAKSAALAGLKRCARRLEYNWNFFKYAYQADFEDMIQAGYARYLRYCIEELGIAPPNLSEGLYKPEWCDLREYTARAAKGFVLDEQANFSVGKRKICEASAEYFSEGSKQGKRGHSISCRPQLSAVQKPHAALDDHHILFTFSAMLKTRKRRGGKELKAAWRDAMVVFLASLGYSNSQIAYHLGYAYNSVKIWRRVIRETLQSAQLSDLSEKSYELSQKDFHRVLELCEKAGYEGKIPFTLP